MQQCSCRCHEPSFVFFLTRGAGRGRREDVPDCNLAQRQTCGVDPESKLSQLCDATDPLLLEDFVDNCRTPRDKSVGMLMQGISFMSSHHGDANSPSPSPETEASPDGQPQCTTMHCTTRVMTPNSTNFDSNNKKRGLLIPSMEWHGSELRTTAQAVLIVQLQATTMHGFPMQALNL